ncbi:MAG: hypothetical protein KDJ68_13150 [Rhodobiaceae bacterium]|nr:hypothetical protein [Rhodobiaceae bacterium]
MSDYRHTQPGVLMLAIFAVVVIALAGFAVASRFHPFFLALVVAALLLGALVSSLTVRIAERMLTWHFSFGFWKKSMPLGDIVSAEPVINKWWWGWGIRFTPHGWLYNVSGLQAVEITKRDGSAVRIGTDEPQALAAAIRKAIA